MNVVPNERVRRLAEWMIGDASEMPGADAVIRHAKRIRHGDVPALLAILLDETRTVRKLGAPTLPLVMSPHERSRGYAAYRRGERSEFAITAFREYQRVQQKRHRERSRGVA